MEQISFFNRSGPSDYLSGQPLASRLRPKTLDDFVGQAHLVSSIFPRPKDI
jgi:replication-associated recombination protein RarA